MTGVERSEPFQCRVQPAAVPEKGVTRLDEDGWELERGHVDRRANPPRFFPLGSVRWFQPPTHPVRYNPAFFAGHGGLIVI